MVAQGAGLKRRLRLNPLQSFKINDKVFTPKAFDKAAGCVLLCGLLISGHPGGAVRGVLGRHRPFDAHVGHDVLADGFSCGLHRIESGLEVYLCDPQSPWQRGSNENTNGVLRQYFPKGTDLSRWSAEELEAVARTLNNRPRETLGWKTPAEALNEQLQSIEQAGVATID